jgi:hypothetical protein
MRKLQRRIKIEKTIVCVFIFASLFLNSLYLNALLPNSWHPDERVVPALAIAKFGPLHEKTLWTIGHFHKYVLLVAMSPYYLYLRITSTPLPQDLETASDSFITTTFVLSRIVSVIFGTATFFMIYLILNLLFRNKVLNIFLSALIGLSMLVVNQSHFATYAMDSFFFASLLIYFLLYFSKYNIIKTKIAKKWRTPILGAIFGILVAGQYTTALYFMLIALFTLNTASQKEFWHSIRKLFSIGMIATGIFIIVNPFVLTQEFYSETFKFLIEENVGSAKIGNLAGNDKHTWLTMLFRYVQSFGIINSILLFCGACAGLFVGKKHLSYIFATWIIFYATIMNFFGFFPQRWMLHFFIPLIILFSTTAYYFNNTRKKAHVPIIIALMLTMTLVNSAQVVQAFKNDSRLIAKNDIEPILKPDDKLLYLYSAWYNPVLSQKKYNITTLSINRLNRTEIDEEIQRIDPDYIFSNSFYEDRFLAAGNDYPKFGVLLREKSTMFPFFTFNPDARDFLLDLRTGKTKYKTFKTYERKQLFPDPDFIDPEIYIYKKESTEMRKNNS